MSTKKHPPAFMLYAQDFSSDGKVEAMTTEEVGAYILLLCKAWYEKPVGSIPDNDATLARWARLEAGRWAECKNNVLAAFTLGTDSRWHQKRLRSEFDAQRERKKERSEAGKKGAAKRYGKKTSIAEPQQSYSTASDLPLANDGFSFSSSISSSPSVNTNTPLTPLGGTDKVAKASKPVRAKKTKPTVEDAKLVAVPESLAISPTFMSQWHAWLEWRWNEKKAPLTPGSVAERLKSFETYGPERSEKAMRTSIANGWIGVFPEKETVDDGSINRNSKTSFSRFDEEVIERNAREFIQRHGSDAT